MCTWNNSLAVGGDFTLVNGETAYGIFLLNNDSIELPILLNLFYTPVVKCLGVLNNDLWIAIDLPAYQSDNIYRFDGNQLIADTTLINLGIDKFISNIDETKLYIIGSAISPAWVADAVGITSDGINYEFIEVWGIITCIKLDGEGGFYMGGEYGEVNGNEVSNMCHYTNDGQILSFGNNDGTNVVRSIEIYKGFLYLGGEMPTINNLFKIDLLTGIESPSIENSSAYPNPTSGLIHLSMKSGIVTIANIIGQGVTTSFVRDGTLDLTGFAPGVYNISSADNHFIVAKE
jgi:hypothetical protein